MIFSNKNSEVTFLYKKNDVSVYIKREDLLHEHISGNKFRKLKYNILEAQNQNAKTVLTFGGVYSNHITATAYAGKLAGIKTIGVIRGDELGLDLDKTLQTNLSLKFASEQGMEFYFVSRKAYREKHTSEFLTLLEKKFGMFYHVPEGGTNNLAIKGCEEILNEQDNKFDYICTAVGTGGTISGIINTIKDYQKVIGFPALKGDFLSDEIKKYVTSDGQWELTNHYHFGGFAKINSELVSFINSFKVNYEIQLDPIYTGKMMYGIQDLIRQDFFPKGTKILAIHTGGIQGITAMNVKLKNKGLEVLK